MVSKCENATLPVEPLLWHPQFPLTTIGTTSFLKETELMDDKVELETS